jgi:hypothetical protein
MSKKKKAPKASDLLKKALGKVSSMGGAFSAPPSPVADARLNPAPEILKVILEEKLAKKSSSDKRRKTKGILFRMTPELYDELVRCAYTDGESKTITRILTRGAMVEIQRIRAKYPEGLKSPPPDALSDLEKAIFG